MRLAYFADDGSYGSADGMVVVDVGEWDLNDWSDIDEATDSDRVAVAVSKTSEVGSIYIPLHYKGEEAITV